MRHSDLNCFLFPFADIFRIDWSKHNINNCWKGFETQIDLPYTPDGIYVTHLDHIYNTPFLGGCPSHPIFCKRWEFFL